MGVPGSGLNAMDKSDYEVLTVPGDREYYYNKVTKQSTFTKPDVLKNTDDHFDIDPWVECKSSRGKTFHHNTITKESRWSRPRFVNKENKVWISGVGSDMRITNHEVAKYLLGRLMEQNNISNVREAFYKLSTEPVFRAITECNRRAIIKEYVGEKEKIAMQEEMSKQNYYKEEVCKIRVDVNDFFEFNSIFNKYPYYTRIKDKFSCYEMCMERYKGDTTMAKLDAIFRDIGVGIDTSVVDILGLKELEQFDKRCILLRFSKYFRNLEREHLSRFESRKRNMMAAFDRHKHGFRELLQDLYKRGHLHHRMKFKNAFHQFKTSKSFLGLLGGRESAKDIYFDFIRGLDSKPTSKIDAEEREEGEIV